MLAEGEFALRRDYVEKALTKAIDPVKWGSAPSELDLQATLVDTASRQRDEEALTKALPLLEERSTVVKHTLFQGVAERGWGVAYTLGGRYPEAARRLNSALRRFRRLRTRWQEGRTRYELAELARAQGDEHGARAHYSKALAAFETMGAVPDVERTLTRLATLSPNL